MNLQPPRVAALHDMENRLRRDWQALAAAWQQTSDTWKDRRRREFEDQYLRELPIVLSRAQAELTQFRETMQRAMRALADDEPQP